MVFDGDKLREEMTFKYNLAREKEKKLREQLKDLGFKNHSYCGKNILERFFGNSKFLVSLISFHYTCDYGYSIEWSLGLRSTDNSLKYIELCSEAKENYLCGIVSYVLTKDKTIIFTTTRTWSNNQLQYAWKDSQYKEMIEYLQNFIEQKELQYQNIELIARDVLLQDNEENVMYRNKYNQNRPLNCHIYDIQAILYIHFGQNEKSISLLEESIKCEKQNITIYNSHIIKSKQAYLDHLKNGTPLPYIPFPNDIVSVFNTKGEDIYIAINKKAIKDSELLEYFSPQDSFAKAKKISFDDTIDDEGIIISKLGKWCILRLSFDMINEFSQDQLETLLKTLSEKYTQTILFINQDVTATFGFEVYKKGELLRKWMAGDGEVLENIGKPLKNEKKQFLDTIIEDIDEQSVTSFLDTFIKVSHNDLDNSKSVYYALK